MIKVKISTWGPGVAKSSVSRHGGRGSKRLGNPDLKGVKTLKYFMNHENATQKYYSLYDLTKCYYLNLDTSKYLVLCYIINKL